MHPKIIISLTNGNAEIDNSGKSVDKLFEEISEQMENKKFRTFTIKNVLINKAHVIRIYKEESTWSETMTTETLIFNIGFVSGAIVGVATWQFIKFVLRGN